MRTICLVIVSIFLNPVMAADHLPETLTQNNNPFERCNKFTLRYGFVIKVAEIGWYAPDCSETTSILEEPNKIVRFHYFKNVDADFFKESAEEYFLLNLANMQKLQNQMKAPLVAFNAGYTDIADGEYFDLVHTNGSNLSLYKNDELLMVSENSQFSNSYFNIWFGDIPVISKLKFAFTECTPKLRTC